MLGSGFGSARVLVRTVHWYTGWEEHIERDDTDTPGHHPMAGRE